MPIEGRPVRDGWVTVDRGRIVATGHRTAPDDIHEVDLGEVAVMPGLVNIYAGSLDDTAQFKPQMAIFTRSRPAWDDSSRNLKCFETVPSK